MHIGIIQYKNKIIYVDLKDNKIYGYYYHNKKKHIISLNTIAILVNSLFDKSKEEFLKQQGEYTVFINKETAYKHFYKDGKEDLLKFFLENGQNGIMYEDKKNNKNNQRTKSCFNRKKMAKYIMGLTLYSALFLSTYKTTTYIISELNSQEIQELEEAATETTDNQYYDFESICNAIQLATTLSDQDKNFLYNEELFKAISNTPMTEDRIMSLEEKLTDIKILPFTEEDKEENKTRASQGLLETVGYYNPLTPNIFYMENLTNQDTKTHEFIHLLQDNNNYYYIREASAEIISNEYYGALLDSYKEEAKRIKVLMEIIGTNPIWNVNFSGSEEKLQEFNDILYNNLSYKEYGEITEILTTSPSDKTPEEMKKINENLDKILANLYNNIYHEPIENNEIIQYIYGSNNLNTTNCARHYFQDRENKEGRKIEKLENIPLIEAIQEENIEIEFYNQKEVELTKEEYLKEKKEGKNVSFTIKELAENVSIEVVPDPSNEEIHYLVNNEQKEYTAEELIELGYIIPEFYRIEKEPVAPEDVYYRMQRGEKIFEKVRKTPSEYTVIGLNINREEEEIMIKVKKEVNWEPVKANITETKEQKIFPSNK